MAGGPRPPLVALGRPIEHRSRRFLEHAEGFSAPGQVYEEMISSEDDGELAKLVEEVNAWLPDRRRKVLALYGAGYKRPEIAERLGLREWVVKRDLRRDHGRGQGRHRPPSRWRVPRRVS
ncbi:MAG TPA: hypothetical protein VKB23_09405 [Solirubrobacterales bacterium]|nr:hypothetical protein [Solirubrobacterales bacterium]